MQNTKPVSEKMANDIFSDEFCTFVEDILQHFHTPSVCIGIIDNEQTHIKCFGNANLSGEPATEDTLYYLASVTKSFTATTLLSVLEELPESKIDLNTKLSSIIPDDFVLSDEYATKHATLADAFGHVLGVTSSNVCYGGEGYTVRDAVQSLRHLHMSHELRQKYEYLNMGYMTIQHVVEILTGEPIENAHHRHIWGPLAMTSTFPSLAKAKASRNTLAKGHEWDLVLEQLDETAYAQDYPLIGGGGLIISIKDLTAYLKAVVNGTLPLNSNRQKDLFKPQAIRGESSNPHESTPLYAMGWYISQLRGHRLIDHNGGIQGFSSQVAFFPDRKWGFAILANGGNIGYAVTQTVKQRLIDDYLQVRMDEREDSVTRYDKMLADAKEEFLNARTRLYPDIPDPELPLSLPFSAYAGSYYNPAYRTIVLSVEDAPQGFPLAKHTKKVLHAELNRLVHFTFDFEHVSGDDFICWRDTKIPDSASKGGYKSRFILDSDSSTVKELGVDIERNDRFVWFQKVKG